MNYRRWKYNVENIKILSHSEFDWGPFCLGLCVYTIYTEQKYIDSPFRSCVAYTRTTMLNAVRATSAIFFFSDFDVRITNKFSSIGASGEDNMFAPLRAHFIVCETAMSMIRV